MPFFYDNDAIHLSAPGEINNLTEKTAPASTDLLVIEDSADSDNKKKITIGNLFGEEQYKRPVRVRAQGNITLAAPGATIDGITMNVNDRVCCDQQTTTTQDGLYLWQGASTPMVRSGDAAVGASFGGSTFVIQEGTNATRLFECTNITGSDIIGTDNIVLEDITGDPRLVSNLTHTSLLTGGIITVNGGDPSLFDVSAGYGYVINNYTDPLHPVRTFVSWSTMTGVTLTYILSANITYVMIDSTGALIQQTTRPTEAQFEDNIVLAGIGHQNHTSVQNISPVVVLTYGTQQQLRNFLDAFGAFNKSGNVISNHGSNLQIKRSAGETFKADASYYTSTKTPNTIVNPLADPQLFLYAYRNVSGVWTTPGYTYTVDPNNYDPGGGAGLVAVTAGKWTVQYIFFYPDVQLVAFQYGQVMYDDKASALSHTQDAFVLDPDFATCVFLGYLTISQGATDLSNAALVVFTAAGKFGLSSIVGGGEVNTASNAGTGGTGLYYQKVGVNLQFKNLIADSSKLSVTDYPTPHNVGFDVVEANIVHQNISGHGTNDHTAIDSHIGSTSNPHSTTASQVGLGNVSNNLQLTLADFEALKFKSRMARVRAPGNINLSAPGATIDTITMAVGDRVLCDRQTTTTQDGIYAWQGASTPMTRTADAAIGMSFADAVVIVSENSGGAYGAGYQCTNAAGSDVIGTDDLTFSVVFGGNTKEVSNLMSTGVLKGGIISKHGSDPATTIDITAGIGYIVNNYTDSENPVRTRVEWDAKSNVTLTYLGSATISYIAIDENGDVLQFSSRPDTTDWRDYIMLGGVGHENHSYITNLSPVTNIIYDVQQQTLEFLEWFGDFKISGNVVGAYGSDLRVTRSAGSMFKRDGNYWNSAKDLNTISNAAGNPQLLVGAYRNTSGVFVPTSYTYYLDPEHYDPGGSLGLVDVPTGKWTNQYLFKYAAVDIIVVVQYGQTYYDDKPTALAHLQDGFIFDPDLATCVFLGYVTIQQGTTDDSDTDYCVFTPSGKFGLATMISGAGGGEVNTASNIGTSGVGVYAQKSGVDLQFKNIKAASTKVSVYDNTTPHTIDIDVAPGNIAHQDLSGAGTNTHSAIDSHIASTSNPHSVTASQVGLGSVTNDAQLKRAAGDFSSFTNKASPVGADVLLIEDSAASGAKKYTTISSLSLSSSQVGLGNVTNDAQLKRAAADFASFTLKAAPTGSDILLIEDAAATGAKKYILINTLALDKSQVGLGSVTNDAQLKRAAGDFSSFTVKSTPVGADVLLIEDSAATGAKKYITISTISHTLLADIGTNAHSTIDSHLASTSNPHSTTASQVGLGSVTNDAQLKRAAGDFSSFTNKASPVSGDVLLIEDSAAAGAKKYTTIGSLTLTPTQVGLSNVTNNLQIYSSNFPSSSVDSEVVLFSGTGGKTVKRATGSGLAKLTSGVLSIASAGTDYEGPITAGTTAQYWRGDKSWQTLNASAVGLGNVTNDSQLKRAAGDFSSFTNKASPVGADVLLIEDSAASGAKKYTTISSLALTSSQVGLGNVTNDSQLKRSANDFSSFTVKSTPVGADILLIEDSAAAGAKKYVTISTLPVTAAFSTNYVIGLAVSRNSGTPNTQIDIAIGAARSADDTTNLVLSAAITGVNIAVNGANGLDTGSKANSTWYYIYLIYNPSTVTYAGLISLSSSAPTMPSGYTQRRRIGSTYVNSSGNFRAWVLRYTIERYRKYLYENETITTINVLNAGTAGSYTDVNCSAFIPPTSTLGYFMIQHRSGRNYDSYVNVRPNGLAVDPPIWRQHGGSNAESAFGGPFRDNASSSIDVPTDASQIIEYMNSNSGTGEVSSIWVMGYIEFI